MILQEIYTVLKSAVGTTKVYPVLAAKNAKAPFVVYQHISTDREMTLSSYVDIIDSHFRIDIYDHDFLNAANIAHTIISYLKSYKSETVRYFAIDNSHDGSDISGDDTLYRYILDIRAIHEE